MKYWIPLIAWVLLIFLGSGDSLSAEHTSRFIEPFLAWLWPNLSTERIEQIHFDIRKASHIIEYAILALLLLRAVAHNRQARNLKSALFLALWITCIAVAAADEFRQTFTESRGPSPWDVMIDAIGALVGLTIYWFMILRCRPRSTVS